MKTIASILQKIVHTTNRMIDSIDIRTQQSIKEGFFFISFLLFIGAILWGYHLGKESAKPAGKPYAEITNDVFDLDIKMKREPGSFQSMLESALMEERQHSTDTKIAYPTQQDEALTMPTTPVDIQKDVKEVQKPLIPQNDAKPIEPYTSSDYEAVVKPIDTIQNVKKTSPQPSIKPTSPSAKPDEKEVITSNNKKEFKSMDIREKVFEK